MSLLTKDITGNPNPNANLEPSTDSNTNPNTNTITNPNPNPNPDPTPNPNQVRAAVLAANPAARVVEIEAPHLKRLCRWLGTPEQTRTFNLNPNASPIRTLT